MRNPLRVKTGHRGLTRVELVAALGFLAILSFLGMGRMPTRDDFLRDRVYRARSRMWTVTVALEAYKAAHHEYPPASPIDWKSIAPGKTIRPDMQGITTWPSSLGGETTKITDPFEGGVPFAYIAKGDFWIIYSPGPDGVYDLRPDFLEKVAPAERDNELHRFVYDSLKGARSGGDILCTSDSARRPR